MRPKGASTWTWCTTDAQGWVHSPTNWPFGLVRIRPRDTGLVRLTLESLDHGEAFAGPFRVPADAGPSFLVEVRGGEVVDRRTLSFHLRKISPSMDDATMRAAAEVGVGNPLRVRFARRGSIGKAVLVVASEAGWMGSAQVRAEGSTQDAPVVVELAPAGRIEGVVLPASPADYQGGRVALLARAAPSTRPNGSSPSEEFALIPNLRMASDVLRVQADGAWAFTHVAPGAYVVWFRAANGDERTADVVVVAGETTRVELSPSPLPAEAGVIAGIVTCPLPLEAMRGFDEDPLREIIERQHVDEANPMSEEPTVILRRTQPFAGDAEAWRHRNWDSTWRTVSTGSRGPWFQGEFRFDGVPPGEYTLEVDHPGWTREKSPARVVSPPTTGLVLGCHEGAEFVGLRIALVDAETGVSLSALNGSLRSPWGVTWLHVTQEGGLEQSWLPRDLDFTVTVRARGDTYERATLRRDDFVERNGVLHATARLEWRR